MIDLHGINKQMWPVHPEPLDGELLSSWMVRLAYLNGCRVYPFFSQTLGKDKAIWNRDIDRHAPEWLIKELSKWTGVPQKTIQSTTLKSYEGYLFETNYPNGNMKGILPLGIYHRKRKRYGLQYCPVCLSEDKIPYFRKVWRVPSFAVCLKHEVMLNDRCHNCDSPVMFSRLDMHQVNWNASNSRIDICSVCRKPLHTPITNNMPSYDYATDAYKKWFMAAQTGHISIGNHNGLHSFFAFKVLHQLCKLLVSSNTKRGLPFNSLANELGVKHIEPISGVFEHNPPEVRSSAVWVAMWVLEDWPNRFIKVMDDAQLSSSWILKDMQDPLYPHWFHSVVIEHFYYMSYS